VVCEHNAEQVKACHGCSMPVTVVQMPLACSPFRLKVGMSPSLPADALVAPSLTM
jgi:hypothetical protein